MPPLLVLPFPQIDPIAVAFGPFAIRWYALAYVVGIVGGWWYSRRLVADPLEILTIWHGGMSFHGGFLGTILAVVLFARSRGLNILSVLDVAAVVTPIGLFTGRLANFVNGELWGRPAGPDVPWAMVFPRAGPEPRHPSQLYEAFAEGFVLLVILAIAARVLGFRRPGLLSAIFVGGYAVARITCEVFREPDEQLGFLFGGAFARLGGITMGQVLSLPMLLLAIALAWAALRGLTVGRAAPAAEARA